MKEKPTSEDVAQKLPRGVQQALGVAHRNYENDNFDGGPGLFAKMGIGPKLAEYGIVELSEPRQIKVTPFGRQVSEVCSRLLPATVLGQEDGAGRLPEVREHAIESMNIAIAALRSQRQAEQ